MRKYKFIALALVLAVMLMGAGYAYWTETLTVSGTVTTGDMNVVFAPANIAGIYDGVVNVGDILRDLWEAFNGEDFNSEQAQDMTVSLEPSDDYKKLTFNITNMYPGTGGWVSFSIVNEGTVPVTLKNITPNIVIDSGLKDELNYIIHPVRVYRYYNTGYDLIDGLLHGWDFVEWVTTEPIYCSTFNEYITQLSNIMKDVTLKPGEYIEHGDALSERGGYNIVMPKEITSDSLEGATFSFNLELNYEQGE